MKTLRPTLLLLAPSLLLAFLPACDDPVRTSLQFLKQIAARHEVLSMERALSGIPGSGVEAGDGIRGMRPGLGRLPSDVGAAPAVDRDDRVRAMIRMSRDGIPTDEYRILARRRVAFRNCYEHALKVDPSLAGSILVRIDIPPGGAAIIATILSNTVSDPTVATCVLRQLKRLRFPVRDNLLRFEIRMDFTRAD